MVSLKDHKCTFDFLFDKLALGKILFSRISIILEDDMNTCIF